MGQKIVVGPVSKGLRTDLTPFNIDNDSFPTLVNAYQWRGRVKRKRGTSQLGRLQRTLVSVALGNTNGSGAFTGNLLTLAGLTSESNASIQEDSITITVGAQTFLDNGAGELKNGNPLGEGTINYATGAITFQTDPVLITTAATATFTYYPSLPVMGLKELRLNQTADTQQLGFDTKYAYNIPITTPYTPYGVSFYKNPPNGTYPLYVAKGTWTPVSWNGQDYQQFYTVNYQDALWATNGVNVPFVSTQYGMQFQKVTAPAVTAATTDTVTFTLGANPLVIGDFVFVNEFTSAAAVTPPNSILLNQLTGYVIATGAGTVDVKFPNAAIPADTYTGGLLQFLTNRSSTTRDCIRL